MVFIFDGRRCIKMRTKVDLIFWNSRQCTGDKNHTVIIYGK